jgi:hypothetical protein|tara:strand:+ start:20793 stop:21548 length:756 start_codon:yes stop_codon:yes gene_type:complete
MFNFNKINILKKQNFTIFEIPNFLSEIDYYKIRDNLPDIHLKDVDKKYILDKKIGIQPFDGIYDKYILNNEVLKNFHNQVYDEKFLERIFNYFKKEILVSRKQDYNYYSKLILRKNKFILKNKKRKFYEKFLYNYIYPSIQYSYMFNDAKINPHTDSRAKLISLMLYFPDEKFSEEDLKNLGTTFFKNDKSNINNKYETFETISDDNFTLPFKPRNLYGFIRNEKAWHAVKPIKIEEGFSRKSINININFG